MTIENKAALIAAAPKTISIITELARLLETELDLFTAAKIAIIKESAK